MPEIKLKEVLQSSHQDATGKYPAENLLRGGKWLGNSRAVSSLSAVFRLSDCCCISSIHVGNSGSAVIAIQVRRIDGADFEDLLPSSVLMTSQECKIGQNTNSVKIYNKEDFLGSTREGKWSEIKVLVTQPYNQQVLFGLCFLRIFSFQEEDTSSLKTPFDFSKWEKLKSLSPSNSKLSRKDRLLHSQSPSRYQDEGKRSTVKKECEEEDTKVFETSVRSFLESLKLRDKDLDTIQLVAVRKRMEIVHGRAFSSKEREIFIATVKKFVVSMKSSKVAPDTCHNIGKETSSTNNKLEPMPRDRLSLNSNIDGVNSSSSSGRARLTGRKVNNINIDKKSPSVRRNVISLEGSSDGKIRGLGDTSNNIEQSVQVSDPSTLYLNKKLKRKYLTVEEESTKHHKLAVTEVPVKMMATKNSFDRGNLVECPICKVYFEADSIENHSSECIAFAEDAETEAITCPMCSKKISSAIADIHANQCASEMFGD